MTSNKKVEKLQEELDSVQVDVSTFMVLLESLADTDTAMYPDDYDTKPYVFNHVPEIVSLLTFSNQYTHVYMYVCIHFCIWWQFQSNTRIVQK